MAKSIKIQEEEYAMLQKLKSDTGIRSSTVVLKLAFTSFIQSREFAKIKAGKEIR